MESIRHPIFESFPLISIVFSYYGFTHESYLLLWSLSSKTRKVFYENYETFRRIMKMYNKSVEINALNEIKDYIINKLDLFILNVKLVENAETLINFADKLYNKEGCKFGDHYMCEQVCMSSISLNADDIVKLHPHIEKLKVIQVIQVIQYDKDFNEYQPCTLLDLIYIKNSSYEADDGQLRLCYFQDSECKKANPIFQSFKRMEEIVLYNDADEYLLNELKLLKKAKIDQLNQLCIYISYTKTLEKITNPENYNYQIKLLECNDQDVTLNNKILENISLINPKYLSLGSLNSISKAYRMLSILSVNSRLQFCDRDTKNYILFCKNCELFLNNEEKKIIKLHCNWVGFKYNKNCLKENDILFMENGILINNFSKMECCILKKEKMDIKSVSDIADIINLGEGSYILIPYCSLPDLMLGENFYSSLRNDINKRNFLSLPLNIKVSIKTNYGFENNVQDLNKVILFVPKQIELIFECDVIDLLMPSKSLELLNTSLLRMVAEFRLREIVLDSFYINSETAILILTEPLVQNSLQRIEIFNNNVLDCLSILSLCTKCRMIEHIHVYVGNEVSSTWSEEDIKRIREAVINIKHRFRNIRQVSDYIQI